MMKKMSMMRRVPVLGLTVFLFAFPVLCGAQSMPPNSQVAEPEMPPATSAVTLDGKILFRVRGVSAYPAETRARDIGERILELARDETVPPQALRVVEQEGKSQVYAGDRLVFTIVDADARAEGVERPLLANVYLAKISTAVETYRRDRAPRAVLTKTLHALLAVSLFLVFLLCLRWAFRRFDHMFERRIKSKLEELEAASRRFLQAGQLWSALRQMLRTLHLVLVLVGTYACLEYVLALYPWTRALAERMRFLLLDPLSVMGRAFVESLPNIAFLAVLAIVTRILLRSIRLFFANVAEGTIGISGFDPEWGLPTFKIIRLFVIAFAVMVAYPYIPGSGSAAFKGVTIFLGVIMSLGSSSVIANIIAGYAMIYRRAFRIGDRIQVDRHTGDVLEIRNLVTRLRTPKNEEVVLPNSVILNSHVVNYSALAKKQGVILHTTVGIGYETPWRQVEAMLLTAAERTPGLMRELPPFVHVKSLGDFAVTHEINVYCDEPAAMPALYSALHKNILDIFNEYGIQIMTPAYEGDPEKAKVVPREQWYASPAKEPSGDKPA